jgi:hypothetical protein
MNIDSEDRLDRLFEEARTGHPDTSAREMNFETRVMARIRERQEAGIPWYALVWRMIPAFAVIAAITVVCTMTINPAPSRDLFAAITTGQDDFMAKSFLTGE